MGKKWSISDTIYDETKYTASLQKKIINLKLDNELKQSNIDELHIAIWELEWENSFLKDKIGLYNAALKLYEWLPDQERYIYMAIDSLSEMFCAQMEERNNPEIIQKLWGIWLVDFKLAVLTNFRKSFEESKKQFWL